MLPLPAAAVSVPLVQVVEAFGGVATTSPAGRLSVTDRFVAAAVLLELLMVKVSVAPPLIVAGFGEKLLLNVGGGLTRNVADVRRTGARLLNPFEPAG